MPPAAVVSRTPPLSVRPFARLRRFQACHLADGNLQVASMQAVVHLSLQPLASALIRASMKLIPRDQSENSSPHGLSNCNIRRIDIAVRELYSQDWPIR